MKRTADPGDTLAGGGEMGALMRARDWAATPLGLVAAWPQSLRTAVSICLNSRFPMLVFWGPQLIMLYNDGYRYMLGSKHPQALGQPARECWAEIWDIIGPMMEGVLFRGEATWSEDELLLLERYGYPEESYFTFSFSPIRDETGGIGGVFTAVTETTQRVLGERRVQTLRDLAARSSAARTADDACVRAVEALAGNAADLPFTFLYLLDSTGETIHLAGTTGLDPAGPGAPQLVDLRTISDAVPAWPLAEVVQTGQAVVVEDLTACFNHLVVSAERLQPQSALILPVAQPGQERVGGLLVTGISPRRALDDDYRGFLELVAGQVATALANARAYQEAQARAEALAEIDRAKTLFFSNVSHEFRTPLTLLLGPLEDALADAALAPAQHERLEIAHRNALRLLKLVNTLLDFSRIEAGRIEAVYEPVDLATFTADLASVFRAAVERAGLRLIIDCPPLAEPVYVDREMWEKIVLNLLSNAFKFTFTGEIAVSLRQAGNRVELAVRDTGTGIPADEVWHLFERFHRVRGARGRTFEGTGIGLALVQELVHLHGGTVTVSSELGAGSTFTILLPLGKDHLPADRIRTSPAAGAAGPGVAPYVAEALRWNPDGTSAEETPIEGWLPAPEFEGIITAPKAAAAGVGERPYVLLADDNADMRDYLCRLLSAYWDVEAMPDGRAALEAIRTRRPALVLSDVMMPGLDGVALLRELRADPRTQHIPVILLSARAGQEAALEGLAAGADDYLIKPFSATELLARVRTHLELARQRAEALQAAEEALHVRDQFLSIAAHELKTPLTSLLGYAQFLRRRMERDGGSNERDQRAVEVIVAQSRRLGKLIDSLLDISRIRTGQFTIDRQRMDLTALVHQVVEEAQPALEKHTIAVEGDEAPIFLAGDALRLDQVLQNLVQNAIKYSPAGGTIRITLAREDNQVTIAVRDPGIGIPEADIGQLFTPFFRASNVGDSPISGMGIGLYVVREITALHGGRVAVESVEGQGSTFTIRLPLTDAPATNRAGSAGSRNKATATQADTV